MPVTKHPKIPCDVCGYEAWSDTDLANHKASVHQQGTPIQTPPTPEAKAPEKVVVPTPAPAAVPSTDPPAGKVPEPAPELPAGIFVPPPQPNFWVSKPVAKELYIVGKMADRGEIINVKVLGPAGVGKTTLGWEFAASRKKPCFEVHWGMYQEPSEVWGKDRLSMEQGTFYEQARYVDALETPGCVIINDEPNRCPPEVLNANFGLWDWRRAAWVHDLRRTVKVAPGVVFFACMNLGAEYIGTNPMDKAIKERFGRTIVLTWPPQDVESQILQRRTGVSKEVADKLSRFARDIRRDPKITVRPSTRQLLVAAEDVVEGLPIQEAVMYAIINDLDEDVDRKTLLQHLQVIGKVDEAWVNGEATDEDDS
jgi:nitric oxide reductase NorQ protein